MESYVVTEEELKGLVDEYDYNEPNIDDFLKSKQPVKLIEKGLVQGDFGYGLFDEYKGKRIEVYTKEINNKSDNEDALNFIFGDVKSDLSKIKVKPWK